MSCASCGYCDHGEAQTVPKGGIRQWAAGFCTHPGSWFSGKLTPIWLRGCPDYESAPRPGRLSRHEQLQGLADAGVDTLEDYRMEK